MLKYVIVFVAALGTSFLLTPWVRSIARSLGAIDLPGGRKIHSHPIPRLGGFAILITFYLTLFVFSQLVYSNLFEDFFDKVHFGWLLGASAIMVGLGALDDFRRMPPSFKFLFQIIAGLVIALSCCRIEVISIPFYTIHLGILSIPVTVFWIVAITNAINLLDGLDGLAAGTSFIVCMTLFAISLLNQQVAVALISVILGGSILGFLKYNFNPASIFLGDSGAYFLGFILSILSITSSLKGSTTVAILVPIIALGLPLMDTFLSMLRRLLSSLHIVEVDREKNIVKFFYLDGWSVFKADKDHIHHRLLQIGFTQKKAVVFLYTISIGLGALAFSSIYFSNINYALLITAIGLATYIGIRKLGYREVQVLSNGALLPFFDTPMVNRRILRVFVDMAIIAVAYYFAFLLRFEGSFPDEKKAYYLSTLPLVLFTRIFVFYLLGLYKGAWRYASISDLVKMIKAVLSGCAATAILLWIIPGFGIASRAVLLIDCNLLLFFVVGARASFRILDYLNISKNHKGRRILVYGAGKRGVYALKEFVSNPRSNLSPIGFIDDSPLYQGKEIDGFPVLGSLDSLSGILSRHSVSEVILCQENLPEEKLHRLTEICHSYNIPLRCYKTSFEEIPNHSTDVTILSNTP